MSTTANIFEYMAQHFPVNYDISQIILIFASALLFYVALTDLKSYKVRNEVVGVLAILFFAHAAVSGRWILLPWNIGLAAATFGLLCLAYAKRMLGGGDVKLLTIAILWAGKDGALAFSMFLLLFSTIHLAAVKIKFAKTLSGDNRSKIPYAPSIAAALIGTFSMGYLSPLTFTALGPMQ
jgi:prepilin peptidase CpaA